VKIDEEWRELSNRPTIDQALADHARLLERLRNTLTAPAGISPWEQFDGPHRAGCGDALINYGVSEAAKAGFTTVETIVDKPGDHALAIQGPYGAVLDLGVGKRTGIYIRSGCHLLPGATKPTPTPAG
jgi:hypothetical protein